MFYKITIIHSLDVKTYLIDISIIAAAAGHPMRSNESSDRDNSIESIEHGSTTANRPAVSRQIGICIDSFSFDTSN
jgi:hypothetical protein